MKNNLKIISAFLMLLILFPHAIHAEEKRPIKIERLSGPSRVHTSIEIAKDAYHETENVILVGYNGEVDALTGSILAKVKDAPIVFVNPRNISETKSMLINLNVKQVYILGGKKAFPSELENEFTDYEPIRISGQDRFETAALIAKKTTNESIDEIFLALGIGNYADALAIGPVSAQNEKPLLLTSKNSIPNSTLDAIKDMGVKKVNIIGGNVAITKNVENKLKNLGIETKRISGDDRELTAIAISKEFNLNPENIVLTNGFKYADAVVGGYFAAKNDASILLSSDNNISLSTLDYMKNGTEKTYILGGENSINKVVKKDLEYILDGYDIKEEKTDSNIPFKTINKNDSTLKKGVTKIKREGKDGVRTITDRVISKNGQEIERRNISNKIVENPVDKIVLIGTKEEDEVGDAKKEYIYFITNNLNLRKETSINSKILLTIPKGTHLDLISNEGYWYKVKYKNRTGYMSSKYIKRGSGYKVNDTLIVNKGYPLSSNFNPGVNPEALNAVKRMKKDAKKEGITLNVFSDFRTYKYQVNLYNRYVREDGKEKADTYSARPGYSEHQTGLTFDIGGKNPKYYTSKKLGQMKEGIWMAKNSYKYGLILSYPKKKEGVTGYDYEPWHFRYVGVDLAKKVKDSGLTLDEYLNVVHPNYKD
ncbi:MAG: cell wall-binding repeat-containing protein [Tissierella sp.]|uniref:cell wall-binding repeat-containing protein n=1 Tax=Tissierella sp. TaxID=41274 RepID=UPI003F9972CB